jgi:hypothetical protein
MSFASDLNGFANLVERRTKAAFVMCATEVQRSVVEGSEITGAPGQPVDTGNLRDSWIPEFVSDTHWQTTTKVEYAPHVEDNVRGVQHRNHGPHSVKLTVAGWQRIVSQVCAEVKRA